MTCNRLNQKDLLRIDPPGRVEGTVSFEGSVLDYRYEWWLLALCGVSWGSLYAVPLDQDERPEFLLH